jgi:hypothetical protein
VTVLLDESVPVRLAKALAALGCDASPFPKDWKGLKNGELLRRLRERGIGCLISCDKNLRYQQTIGTSGISLVVLPSQRFGDLAPFVPVIVEAASRARPGVVLIVNLDATISNG